MTMRMLSTLSLMLLVQACVALDEPLPPRVEREYVTGSALPHDASRRAASGVTTVEPASVQRELDAHPAPPPSGMSPR